jgi:hypothetical protein
MEAKHSARPAVSSVRFQQKVNERNKARNMTQPPPEIQVSDMPLPETQRELELLLEALHALNSALDHYETEVLAPATTA